MGRTIPTANMLIEQEIGEFLRSYGKGLSGKHEETLLYNLLQLSKRHMPACSQAVRRVPFHGILMSLMLEQQKQILALTEEISKLVSKEGNLIEK